MLCNMNTPPVPCSTLDCATPNLAHRQVWRGLDKNSFERVHANDNSGGHL